MLKVKLNPNVMVALTAIVGLILIIGCGTSPEAQQMTDFVQEFGQKVAAYAKAEDGQKADLAAKVEADMDKWTLMKSDIGGEVTPQVLEKLETEYKKYAQEFKSLSGQS